jgi:hypothetical protein
MCEAAAKGGHLVILQWLPANGCDWSADTCHMDAVGGHLAVLQWAWASGCAWNAATRLRMVPAGSKTCEWIEAHAANLMERGGNNAHGTVSVLRDTRTALYLVARNTILYSIVLYMCAKSAIHGLFVITFVV